MESFNNSIAYLNTAFPRHTPTTWQHVTNAPIKQLSPGPSSHSAMADDLITNPDEIDYNDPPFPLTTIDREILATKDEDYHRITWEDLKEIIGTPT